MVSIYILWTGYNSATVSGFELATEYSISAKLKMNRWALALFSRFRTDIKSIVYLRRCEGCVYWALSVNCLPLRAIVYIYCS